MLESAQQAAQIRLRPILMTLISTVMGALPLVLASGAGSGARSSIGWVIFGGLGISGPFTLLVTPLIYLPIKRAKRPRFLKRAELSR